MNIEFWRERRDRFRAQLPELEAVQEQAEIAKSAFLARRGFVDGYNLDAVEKARLDLLSARDHIAICDEQIRNLEQARAEAERRRALQAEEEGRG